MIGICDMIIKETKLQAPTTRFLWTLKNFIYNLDFMTYGFEAAFVISLIFNSQTWKENLFG